MKHGPRQNFEIQQNREIPDIGEVVLKTGDRLVRRPQRTMQAVALRPARQPR
jgi:hypothetical protein